MDKILNEILEENKGYTMYWKFDYCANSGWKTKNLNMRTIQQNK